MSESKKMSVGYLRYYSGNVGIKARTMLAVANLYDFDFFIFSPKDVNIKNKTINGLFWDNDLKKRVRKETPYPDIIDDQYNFKRKDPEIYEELSKYSYLIYMPIGRKSQVFDKLKDTLLSKYLIESYKFDGIKIDEVLDKHKTIILKPNNSGRGLGIYKLTKKSKNSYYLQFEHKDRKLSADEFINEYYEEFKPNYIVQPFINSVTETGNPFDIRVHLRRANEGKWSLALLYPRIGSAKGVVSNVARGGYVSTDIKSFLECEIGDNWKHVHEELIHISNTIPDVLQGKHKKIIDALAVDVAINKSNNNELKFFEINTYPGVMTYPFESSEASVQFYLYLMELKRDGKL